MFVAFSCRGRCVCPSCHEKRALEKAAWVSEHVCAEVPHRQFVFTMPKRLRLYFRYDRSLLGALCQAAWRTVCTVYQAASGRPDGVPGMVGAIQTFGDLIHFHPHIHALVSEGVFLPDGTFLPLPKLASEPFLKLWEQEVFARGFQHIQLASALTFSLLINRDLVSVPDRPHPRFIPRVPFGRGNLQPVEHLSDQPVRQLTRQAANDLEGIGCGRTTRISER